MTTRDVKEQKSGHAPDCRIGMLLHPSVSAPAAPLEKAVEEARDAAERYSSGHGGAMSLYRATVALLAALDADKRLEKAEQLLHSARGHHDARSPMGYAIDRYFAEKGER